MLNKNLFHLVQLKTPSKWSNALILAWKFTKNIVNEISKEFYAWAKSQTNETQKDRTADETHQDAVPAVPAEPVETHKDAEPDETDKDEKPDENDKDAKPDA